MIKIQHVEKKFGSKVVLKDFSLEVGRGQILYILGRSGTGKSVLLKCMVGLMTVDSGRIWVDDLEVTGQSEEALLEIRRRCALVFQNPALIDQLSVYENVALGLRQFKDLSSKQVQSIVENALDLVSLSAHSKKTPPELSFGMQKRVSVARAICLKPKVLLYDEPTTGLDPVAARQINDLIKALSTEIKSTALVVSHDLEKALDIADHIIVLDQGSIIENTSPTKIFASPHPIVQSFLEDVKQNRAWINS